MIVSSILKPEQQQMGQIAAKIFKLFNLSFRAIRRRKDASGIVRYIESSIKEGDIIFDIGSEEDDYLYIIRRKLGRTGRIIAFESRPYLLQQLTHLKKIFGWKNVELESLIFSDSPCTKTVYNSGDANCRNVPHDAIIINMNDSKGDYVRETIQIDTLDNYCKKNNIHPSFLKIDADGNELKLLKGAMNTLKNDKPKILLKCEEKLAGANNVMETFRYLHQLNYSGYFVLDTIQIPVANFDFNLYQNTYNNFYCNNFMFE